MAYHLKYVRISNYMAAQSNVNPEKCALWKCLCGVAHTDKINTYFKYVKTLRLNLCTHNNNETLCFCKIKQTGCAYSRLRLCELEHETACISLP